MFVLRLDFSTGLHVEYNYEEAARGIEERKLAERGAFGKDWFRVEGDDGREGFFDGATVVGVQLVDVQKEVWSVLNLTLVADENKARWCKLHGIPIPPSLPQEVSGGPVGRG